MTLPRTAAQVLSGHVRLEIRCIDRVLLTFRQPRLQYGQGIHGFFCHHRGNQFVSSALMLPMTERFAADIRHYIDARGLDLVHFAKGQSKDQIARRYLACHDGGEQILFAGVAQEKTRIWRTRQRRDPVTGKRYPWLCQEQAMVNHWYFYGFDAGFGPFYVKFCGYFPYTGQIYINGHEYAKRQCLKAGIGFTALDNAFGSASDPAAVQRICDGLTDQKIYRFAGKWLARLPHPFTAGDEQADYCWQLSVQQAEFSTTMALDRPASGRIFFEQLIRDNIDIGRPDKVNIVFDRKIRLRGKNPTPGTFRTQVITTGACPYLYLYYKKTQVKQYLKEGRALRTETTLNQPRDFGIGKELTNLAAMAEVGYAANRRLLDAECISHDPADGAAALEAITSPVISTTCTRIPGMRFPDPRVQALLGACCALALRPAGFTSRDLRHYLGPQLGKTPEDMTSGQISYDLRRLRAHQLIERIPHSRAYQVTEDGLTIALFLTRLTQRLLIPGLAQLTSPGPSGRSRLRQADRAYRDALTDLARHASLAALPHLQLSPAVITSQHPPVISRHTRRNLTRNSKSLRGKITYGNTGAVAWPDDFTASVMVRRMQAKLHRWAIEDSDRRFGDLFNLVCDPAFLVTAWQRVSTNKGARTAGIDKATAAQIQTWIGVGAFLNQIRDSLKTGEFRPDEVRQVMIPKGNSGKFRKLGIPTIADRVVQASLKLVLEPIFEADFKPCSYGFRPNRRAQDAIAEIHHFASESINYRWVFETDIKACFDEISHSALMGRLRVRIKDKRICALVKAFLKSGVLTDLGDREETLTGTPQGGILSPLLANVALSALDDHFDRQWQQEMGTKQQRANRRRNGQGNWRLCRYADDLVLMVSGDRRHAEALREEVAAVLAPLGLRLSPEKTRVVHIDEGFTFLGFDIRRQRKRGTQKYYVYTKPSRKAIASIRDKAKAKTYRSTLHTDLDALILSLNRSLAGWANYFRHGVSKATFSAVDYFVWGRLMRWIRAKYAGKTGLSLRELRRRFCDQGWRIAYNGVVFTGASNVAVTRYRYRGNTIPTPWTPNPAAASG